nr:hypothetical protein CFP56_56596 [Quercus suber]
MYIPVGLPAALKSLLTTISPVRNPCVTWSRILYQRILLRRQRSGQVFARCLRDIASLGMFAMDRRDRPLQARHRRALGHRPKPQRSLTQRQRPRPKPQLPRPRHLISSYLGSLVSQPTAINSTS